MAKSEKLTKFDPVDCLDSDQAIGYFMARAFETNDPAYVAHALGVVARAKGMTHVGRRLEGACPTLRRTLAAIKALGLNLSVATLPPGR